MSDVAKKVIEIIERTPGEYWSVSASKAQMVARTKAFDEVQELAMGICPAVTGSLRAFKLVDTSHRQSEGAAPRKELAPLREGVPSSLVTIANNAWQLIGGDISLRLASTIISAARVEFARSHFYTLAMCAFDTGNENDMRMSARKRLGTIDWEDADVIVRNPQPVWGYGRDSVAMDFNEWLWERTSDETESLAFNRREPFRTALPEQETYSDAAQYALNAMALTWIDEAAFNRASALQLMAETADVIGLAGTRQGWDAGERYLREEIERGSPQTVTDLARHAANVRHAETRRNAERLQAAYLAGEYPSKDAAAEALCRRFGFGFRAARDHLKGL